MSKFLYPIYKLNIESYKKWWLYHKKAGGGGTLSEILEGFSFNLENTLNRKFRLFDVEGNSTQETTTGKNLLPFEIGHTETKNGVTLTVKKDGIYLTGTPTITSGYIPFNFNISFEAGAYTSFFPENMDGLGMQFPNGNLNFGMADTSTTPRKVTTTDETTGFGSINVRYDVGTLNNKKITPMLMSGTYTSNQEYEPYTNGASPNPNYEQPIYSAGENGSINEKIKNADGTEEQDYSIFVQQPMRSIGDVRDCFVKVDGNWYERHYIGRYIFTGNEYFSTLSQGIYRFNAKANNVDTKVYDNNIMANALSNYFIIETATHIASGSSYDGHFAISSTGTFDFNVQKFASTTELKNWLAEQYANGTPVYVDYLLATPLDLPCTSEQIQQLENLPSTYKDFTYVVSQDETPAHLKIQYWKEVQS